MTFNYLGNEKSFITSGPGPSYLNRQSFQFLNVTILILSEITWLDPLWVVVSNDVQKNYFKVENRVATKHLVEMLSGFHLNSWCKGPFGIDALQDHRKRNIERYNLYLKIQDGHRRPY